MGRQRGVLFEVRHLMLEPWRRRAARSARPPPAARSLSPTHSSWFFSRMPLSSLTPLFRRLLCVSFRRPPCHTLMLCGLFWGVAVWLIYGSAPGQVRPERHVQLRDLLHRQPVLRTQRSAPLQVCAEQWVRPALAALQQSSGPGASFRCPAMSSRELPRGSG